MTRNDAEQIARDFIRTFERGADCELVLLDHRTIERDFGWVFFWDSKRHQETRDISDAPAGNAPVVVTRKDGRVHLTGTARPLEHYLRDFSK
jgi:hypothetical protein